MVCWAHLITALLLYLVTETLWEPKNVLKTRDNPHLLDDHKQFVPPAPSLKIVSPDYPQVWHLINKGHLKISWHCLVNKHLSQNESPSATPYSHIPHSHTICNPGQTWGWLTGSANMFLSWLPSFKLWPHLHIIRVGGRHSDQDQTPPEPPKHSPPHHKNRQSRDLQHNPSHYQHQPAQSVGRHSSINQTSEPEYKYVSWY